MKKLLLLLFVVLMFQFSCNTGSRPIEIGLFDLHLLTFYDKNDSRSDLFNFNPTNDFFGEDYTLTENNKILFTNTDYLHSCSITRYDDEYDGSKYVIQVKYKNGEEYIAEKHANSVSIDNDGRLNLLIRSWVNESDEKVNYPKVVTIGGQECFWGSYMVLLDRKHIYDYGSSGGPLEKRDPCAG